MISDNYASPAAQPVISVEQDEAYGFGDLYVRSAGESILHESPLVPHGSMGSAQPEAPAVPLYTIPVSPYGSSIAASGLRSNGTFSYHQDLAHSSAPFAGPVSNSDMNVPRSWASASVDNHPAWSNQTFLPGQFQWHPQPTYTGSFVPLEITRPLPQAASYEHAMVRQGIPPAYFGTLPQFAPSGFPSLAQGSQPGSLETFTPYMPQGNSFPQQNLQPTRMDTMPGAAWPQDYPAMGHMLLPAVPYMAEPHDYSLSYGSDTTWTEQYTSPDSYDMSMSPDTAPAFGFETPQDSPEEAGYMPPATAKAAAAERHASKDALLLRLKREGKSYRQIKAEGAFTETESTLRGRLRNLVKPKEKRVRKPIWTAKDLELLKRGARRCRNGKRQTNDDSEDSGDDAEINEKKVAWRLVSEYIESNGGTYQFGNTTCKKKWCAIMKR
ncbi:hypothetical protein W97_02544 [Coniosporium apollinis CBS 100218]|uniref:Myb-like domain-containing protein n=1 Tax=Coniosporium apollinis (strain CBS 100218) TaxID=1168221 RepID=R7YN39_CONA1|nr:uncharacterized protein W97_02544 [Coniosporium apollinis CBS 100218]EON63317.1 hypothetical protein W97_02544 [Coniosporium apollinis CBS 100218]